MRQAGVLAAPALVALDLAERVLSADHENAQILADGLRDLGCPVSPVQTNIVNFTPKKITCVEMVRRLKEKNVLLYPKVGEREIRAVTNSTVSKADIFAALDIIKTSLD
jgi:threonine aldolase